MIDNTDRYLNLITRFNDIVRYNNTNNIKHSRELLDILIIIYSHILYCN